MSKLPLWLPPGFDLGDQRRIPVLRIVGIEEGSPEEAVLAERFAGSLRQFFVAQGRNQALGIAPQRRVRVDRGDHQIEYMNQFGQEIVTLHVHPSTAGGVSTTSRSDTYDFLDIRIHPHVIDNSPENTPYIGMSVGRVAIYVRGIVAPIQELPDTFVDPVPDGIGFNRVNSSNTEMWDLWNLPDLVWFHESDFQGPEPSLPEDIQQDLRGWVDLRGFAPDATVAVELWGQHQTRGNVQEVVTGTELAAVVWSAWQTDGSTVDIMARFTSPTYSRSTIDEQFPEYAALSDSTTPRISGFPDRQKIKGGGSQSLIHWSASSTVSNPTFSAMQALDPVGSFTVIDPSFLSDVNYVTSGPTTNYPDTGYLKTVEAAGMYNTMMGNLTKPSATPGGDGWILDDSQVGFFPPYYKTSYMMFRNKFLYVPLTEFVQPPVDLQFDLRALCHKGGVLPDQAEFPMAGRNEAWPSDYGTSYPDADSPRNHFNTRFLGLILADRRTGSVTFQAAY